MLSRQRVVSVLIVLSLLILGWLMIYPGAGTNATQPVKPPGQEKRQRDEFASDRAPTQPLKPLAFDGPRAMTYLRTLCKIGPRVSGSEGMTRQQELLKEHFEKLGAKVEWQRFTARQVSQKQPVAMANLLVRWHPERERRVLLCGHYDTRPRADQEPRPADRDKPFLSANDGTSTVAWLMELGHHLPKANLSVGVDFALFDGEEYVFDGPGPSSQDRYFLGSEHFASEYVKKPPQYRYFAAILLDLFAGKNAQFPVEQNSWFMAGRLAQEIWGTANEMKVGCFLNRMGTAVNDDHIALNRAGIPAIDIIDFDYPHWHRLSDTPEACAPESMEAVARVLTVWLQRQR